MNAKSSKGRATKPLKTALAQSMSDDFQPTLAVAFHSINIEIFGLTIKKKFFDFDIKKKV